MVMTMAMAMVTMDDYGDDGVDDESICLGACRSVLKTLLRFVSLVGFRATWSLAPGPPAK